jgi:hypothetical protein
VKRESSLSFDNTNSEMNSGKRKRLNWVLEVKVEHPDKQVPTDSPSCLHIKKEALCMHNLSLCTSHILDLSYCLLEHSVILRCNWTAAVSLF